MQLIKYNCGIYATCIAVNGNATREFQFVIKAIHYRMCYNAQISYRYVSHIYIPSRPTLKRKNMQGNTGG